MSRRRRVRHKAEPKDPHYDSVLVAKFVNTVMGAGKKSLAERIVYAAVERANDGSDNVDPLEILTRAVENSKPRVEVKSRRVGGATYQVPLEVATGRQESLAIRWLVNFARARRGTPMHVALSNEIRDAASNSGSAVRRRDEMHKMAQANRAFAHFRW
jgi:small subunit ribosomal protein S7